MEKDNIYSLINKIMSEVGGIEKNSKNTQQGYTFRGIDDLYAALQPPLVKHGVFYVTNVEKVEQTSRESKQGSLLTCTVLTVSFTFYAPDGSSILVRTVGEGMDSGDKSCSKAMSTALKYALLQLFCIPTSEPKDSEHDSPEPVYKRPTMVKIGVQAIEPTMEDWERIDELVKTNHYPRAYFNVWKERESKHKTPTEIYEAALVKFGQPNKSRVEKDEVAS